MTYRPELRRAKAPGPHRAGCPGRVSAQLTLSCGYCAGSVSVRGGARVILTGTSWVHDPELGLAHRSCVRAHRSRPRAADPVAAERRHEIVPAPDLPPRVVLSCHPRPRRRLPGAPGSPRQLWLDGLVDLAPQCGRLIGLLRAARHIALIQWGEPGATRMQLRRFRAASGRIVEVPVCVPERPELTLTPVRELAPAP